MTLVHSEHGGGQVNSTIDMLSLRKTRHLTIHIRSLELV